MRDTQHLIGQEVFIYGLGYIIWDAENAQEVQELFDEIERIASSELILALEVEG